MPLIVATLRNRTCVPLRLVRRSTIRTNKQLLRSLTNLIPFHAIVTVHEYKQRKNCLPNLATCSLETLLWAGTGREQLCQEQPQMYRPRSNQPYCRRTLSLGQSVLPGRNQFRQPLPHPCEISHDGGHGRIILRFQDNRNMS
jgi:hypothetical protein